MTRVPSCSMTTKDFVINDDASIADLSAFRFFMRGCLPAIRSAIVYDLGRMSVLPNAGHGEPLEQRVERHIEAMLAGLETPDQVPQPLIEEFMPLIERHMEIASLFNLLRVYRQHLLEYAISALTSGVASAADALKGIVLLTDTTTMLLADFYHGRLYESIYRQADELRTTKNRLEQSYLSTPLASVEWDTDGRILFWNPSAERIFGWTAEEAVGRNIVELLGVDHDPDAVATLLARMAKGDLVNRQIANRTGDGRTITCQWYNAVLYDEGGDVIGVLSQAEDVTEQLRAEREHEALQQQMFDAQAATLRELSTPLIPLADRVVAMPLIGSIDSTRAQQIVDNLLDGVSANHAAVAILDITGVPVVDTHVANALLRAANAVKLLGARVVLTGIRPEVAQTLVGLGVDLSSIITRGTLQSGIAYAFSLRLR
ncbi:PAS domain S-box protein [Chloroflexia bacterium SDU3-3]|nr:PAS domain S-box protein [Chloroflexia bacterium SDU3-3]